MSWHLPGLYEDDYVRLDLGDLVAEVANPWHYATGDVERRRGNAVAFIDATISAQPRGCTFVRLIFLDTHDGILVRATTAEKLAIRKLGGNSRPDVLAGLLVTLLHLVPNRVAPGERDAWRSAINHVLVYALDSLGL